MGLFGLANSCLAYLSLSEISEVFRICRVVTILASQNAEVGTYTPVRARSVVTTNAHFGTLSTFLRPVCFEMYRKRQ